jgi:hypothetical protein
MRKKEVTLKKVTAPPGRRYLGAQAAADILGCSPRTLIRWEHLDPPRIHSHRLPNGERRYLESDILALLTRPSPPTRKQLAQAAFARAALKKQHTRPQLSARGTVVP